MSRPTTRDLMALHPVMLALRTSPSTRSGRHSRKLATPSAKRSHRDRCASRSSAAPRRWRDGGHEARSQDSAGTRRRQCPVSAGDLDTPDGSLVGIHVRRAAALLTLLDDLRCDALQLEYSKIGGVMGIADFGDRDQLDRHIVITPTGGS